MNTYGYICTFMLDILNYDNKCVKFFVIFKLTYAHTEFYVTT